MFDIQNYLQNQPAKYKDEEAFKNWLRDEADAEKKRNIINHVEKRIRAIAGDGIHIPHVGEKTWKRLKALIKVRQLTLDELMVPTDEEVKLMSKLNDHLLDLTQQLFSKTFEMWKVLNDAGMNTEDHCVEAALDYDWNDEYAVKKLANDKWYASDFTFMLGVLDRFNREDNFTMKHIHELLQNFGMPEEKAREELVGFFDDDDTWTDGALFKPAFNGITVCYMLHAVCCHFHYSLADVLRMNNFTIRVHAEYEHNFATVS